MTTPTVGQIRSAIKAKLEGVPDIGVVNDYERYAEALSDFKNFFVSSGQVRGWIIRRIGLIETSPSLGVYRTVNRWRITGYMSLDDSAATEKTFDDLIETIRAAFRADETLGSVVASTVDEDDDSAGIQLDDSGPVMLAGVLCHSARLNLKTIHFE